MKQIDKTNIRVFTRRLCNTLRAILFAAMIATLAPHRADAQVLYGSMIGEIADTNGGAIPGAAVVVRDEATGYSREGATDSSGTYNFVNLPPGTYTLTISKAGFKRVERRGLIVQANNIARTNVQLEVGALEQTVEVTAVAPDLQTDRAEVHVDVTTHELENLPVPLGRNYQQVYRSLPGFSPPSDSHSIATNPSRALEFHVNGTSGEQNNTRIDGVSSAHVQLPHVVAYIPALESIQEVNVVTNSFDAEQGLAGGAVINVQIKSGGNAIHGSGFEYHSDNHTKAWPWQVPPGVSTQPKLVYNQAGGTIGGPIVKNKLFYFGSYEGTFDHRSVQRKVTVPTAAMKAGDFSSLLDSGITIYNPYADAAGTTLADPSQRVPMAAPGDPRCNVATNPSCLNIIPRSLLNTPSALIAQKMNALWPDPNLPGESNNYFAAAPFSYDRHTIDSKINWNVSDSLTAFWRFGFLHYSDITPTVFGDALLGRPIGGSSNSGHGHGETYTSTFGGTYTIKPTFVIDAYFGFTKQGTASEQPALGKNIGTDVLGIPGTNGSRLFESGWPEFEFDGFATAGIDNNFMPYYRHDPQYQAVVNFNWIRGKHNIRFGSDFYRVGLNQTQAEYVAGGFYGSQGGFFFGRQVTALCQDPPTCGSATSVNRSNAYAAFLLGLPEQASRTLQVPDEYTIRSNLYSAYIRDRWNVTPRLTLDYGMRWERFPYPHRTDRGLERYDPNTNQVLICGMGSVPGDCGVKVSNRRFSPRIGVAWRPTERFVVRAGYGITNDPFEAMELLRNNYPVMVPFGIQTPNTFVPATTLAQGIPAVPVPTLGNGIIDLPLDVGFSGLPQDLHRGYIQSWNFMIQKELGLGFTGQVGYVATRSVRQLGYVDINASQVPFTNRSTQPLYEKFGRTAGTTFLEPLGTGTYDSLQASLAHRFSRGLTLNLHYTYGKAINYVDGSAGTPNIQAAGYAWMNRAPTGFDRTHNVEIANVWELPFGRGRKWLSGNPVVSQVVSGWQVNNLVSMMTGAPFNVTGSCGAAWPGNSPTMVDIVGPANKLGGTGGYNADTGSGSYWYDPSTFAEVFDPNNPGTCLERLGNSGFNNLRGPGIINWDFGIFREFAFTERFHLQFRAEAFNFTNTPHFDIPDNSLGDANSIDQRTGRVIDPGTFMTITGVTSLAREGIDERQFRLGLRLSF